MEMDAACKHVRALRSERQGVHYRHGDKSTGARMRSALVVLRAAWRNVAEGKNRKDRRLAEWMVRARGSIHFSVPTETKERMGGLLHPSARTHLKRPAGDGKTSPLKNLAKKVGPRNILKHSTWRIWERVRINHRQTRRPLNDGHLAVRKPLHTSRNLVARLPWLAEINQRVVRMNVNGHSHEKGRDTNDESGHQGR